MQNTKQNQNKARAAQDFVPIKEIRDGVAILKGGGLRLVLIASSINFALKSEEEQTALLLQYQNFLNSLDFHIQIFVQSRKLDIQPYLTSLENREKEQTNELIKIQTREYIEFIRNFTDTTNVMAKTFFIVVPYFPPTLGGKSGVLSGFLPKKGEPTTKAENLLADFEEHKNQLEQRMYVVEQGLVRTGLRSAKLGTEEIIELFYKLFNPGEMDKPISLT